MKVMGREVYQLSKVMLMTKTWTILFNVANEERENTSGGECD